MISLVEATAECPYCDQAYHQIDSTEERALRIVREALGRHVNAEHAEEAP